MPVTRKRLITFSWVPVNRRFWSRIALKQLKLWIDFSQMAEMENLSLGKPSTRRDYFGKCRKGSEASSCSSLSPSRAFPWNCCPYFSWRTAIKSVSPTFSDQLSRFEIFILDSVVSTVLMNYRIFYKVEKFKTGFPESSR